MNTTTTKQRWKIALVSAGCAAVATMGVIAIAADGAAPAQATVPPDSTTPEEGVPVSTGDRTVTVSGRGTVDVTPDIADLSMGVQSTAPTADKVLDTIETKSRALVDTLKGLGVAAADIRTSGLSLYPNYSEDDEITGYQGSVNVEVTARDIAGIGTLLDGVQGLVGPELTMGGIAFSYDDPEAVLGDARAAAIDNARIRAGQFADAADAEVGAVVKIIESSVPTPILMREMSAADDAAASPIAIEPGTQELSVDVTVVFEMT